MKYNRDAILKFLSSTPKGLYGSEKAWSYETIDKYLREHPDDTEVRDLLLKHALQTPLTEGGGKAMLSAALAHHPNPGARDRLLERAMKSKYREILEWGVQALGALNPQERNPDLVKLLAHRADAANYPFVDAFMRNTLAPDDYNAFSFVARHLASVSHRASASTKQLWQAMLRLERLWGSSVLLPYIVQAIGFPDTKSHSEILNNSILARRVAERHWNAVGRDLLRAIADTKSTQWKEWGIKQSERFDFWSHAVAGVALENADAAFDHIVHDVMGNQDRYKGLIGTGSVDDNTTRLVRLLCVPLSLASPPQLERMRKDLHAFAERLPEWIENDLSQSILYAHLLQPWFDVPDASVGSPMYALRPLVRAMYHAFERKHGQTPSYDYQYQSMPYSVAKGLLPTLLLDSADDIPYAEEMLRQLDNKTHVEPKNDYRVIENARTLLETAFAWDDSDAAEWNKRVRASDELQALLESTSPRTHALWEIAMAKMPGAPSRESVYDSVLNRLFPPDARLEDVSRNLREILELLKSLPRNRSNPEWETMRFTRAVRERFAPAVYDEFLRGLHGDSWNDHLNFLSDLIGLLHGETNKERFIPHIIMPHELLTANPQVVNRKLASLEAMREWDMVSELRGKLCS